MVAFLVFSAFPTWDISAQDLDQQWSARIPISLPGIIQPIQTLKVQSSIGGRITIILVGENERVAEDQLLLTLKDDTQKLQLQLAQMQVQINKNNLKDRERQISLAEVQMETSRNNLKDRERQLILSQLQLQTSRNNLKDRIRQSKLGELQIQTSENNLKDRKRQMKLADTQVEISMNNLKDQQTSLQDILRRLKDEQTLFEQGSSTKSQLEAVQLQKKRGEFAVENAKLAVERARQELNGVRLAVENANISVMRSKQELNGVMLAVENAKIAEKRSVEDVYGVKLAVENARLAVLRSEQELERIKLALHNSRLSVQLAEQEMEIRRDSLENAYVKSRIAGIVNSKQVEVGEVVGAGTQLFEIINLDKVEIVVLVEETDLTKINVGSTVVFTTPAFLQQRFSGTIQRVAWKSDPQTGRYPVYVTADNPRLELRAGMNANVYLTGK